MLRIKKKIKNKNIKNNPDHNGFKLLKRFMIVLVLLYLISGITIVQSDEVAVILRFGKVVGGKENTNIHLPGVLSSFPKPIDEVIKIKANRIYECKIQDFIYKGDNIKKISNKSNTKGRLLVKDVSKSASIDPEIEGYCITGDNNIVQIDTIVKYQVNNPALYLFNIEKPELLIKDAFMASLVKAVGSMSIDTILSSGKKELNHMALDNVQKRLDKAESGISVVSIEFQEIVPPRQVMDEFKSVQNSFIQKETYVKEAQTYKQKTTKEAQTVSASRIRDAEAYKTQIVSKAKGDTEAFLMLAEEYSKNPEIVKERIYREYLKKCFNKDAKITVVPVDENESNYNIIIPGGDE